MSLLTARLDKKMYCDNLLDTKITDKEPTKAYYYDNLLDKKKYIRNLQNPTT
jgi:hypothetical protein